MGIDPLEAIKHDYQKMNTTRRRIADYISSDPARSCFLSIRELAQRAGTTDVTLMSFAKSLGFSSFAEFRKALQEYVLKWSRPSDRMKLYISSSVDASELYKRIVDSERLTIEEASRINHVEDILAAAGMMKDSRRVYIASHNASRVAAEYLQYRMLSLGVEISILDLNDVHLSLTRLLASNPEEAMLVSISTPPYSVQTVAFTKMCRQKGMKVVSFTDSADSPLVPLGDLYFICPSAQTFGGLTNSYVPFFAFFDLLSFFYYFDSSNVSGRFAPENVENEYRNLVKEISRVEY